jgi:transaldolase
MSAVDNLNIKLFADGANIDEILALYENPKIEGFTTNPTLMRKAGISDYVSFAKEVLNQIKDRPISFEVFADDFDNMERQAEIINSWADNVYVKIPITNTKSESSLELVNKLSHAGIKLNITAILTKDQVKGVHEALNQDVPSIVSVFAGRIADTGVDPVPFMKDCAEIISSNKNAELLWASPRELLNVFQADACGSHIITATPDLLKKLELVEKDLQQYSLETVKMFHDDASSAGYTI